MSTPTPIDSELIAAHLREACPERAAELKTFWENFEPIFELKPDGKGHPISARVKKVSWMHKAFAHDWVVAFAGFKSIAPYSPHVLLGVFYGALTAEALAADLDLNDAEAEMEDLLLFARDIRLIDSLDDLDWIDAISEPSFDRALLNTKDMACFDLACISAAATFLHELRHVRFAVEKNSPVLNADEERECDKFSRSMLLDQVEVYCASSGEDLIRVKSKRLMGLAITAFAIVIGEPANMNAAVSDTHPPVKERFDLLVMEAEVPEHAYCWLFIACLLIAILRQRSLLPPVVPCTSVKNLCLELLKLL